MLLERRREPGQDGPTEAGLGHGGGGFTLGGTSPLTVSPAPETRERDRPTPLAGAVSAHVAPPEDSRPKIPRRGGFTTVTFTGGTGAGGVVGSATRSFG